MYEARIRSLEALRLFALFGATLVYACTTQEPSDPLESTRQAVVRGTPSKAARDAVIKLVRDAEIACSGTLIAPNLVLTARHCVAEVVGSGPCGTFGTATPPSALSVVIGPKATDGQTPVASGKRVFVDESNQTCGHDLALLELDRDVPGAKVAAVRFTKATAGESAVLVGYGDNERGTHEHFREERSVRVEAIGPAQAVHRQANGQTIAHDLPAGEIATGQGSCPGDSGGPLLDAKDAVIGVVSRGLGLACGADQATVFSATEAHRKLIEDAAKAAGHPLGGDVGPSNVPGEASLEDEEDDADHEGHDEDDHDHDEDEDTPSGRKKKSRGLARAPDGGAGCAAAPEPARSGAASVGATTLLGLAVVLARRRRARR